MNVSSFTADGLTMGGMTSFTLSTKSLSSKSKTTNRSSNQRGTRKLNYNPREISSAILRASKAQSAGRVTVLAKSKLSGLVKCKGNKQYNQGELNAAIAHAKRMVQCAQMKTQNLRQEERMKKRHEQEGKTEQRQEKNEIKARMAREERNMEQKSRIEHMQRVEKERSLKRELMRRKKLHRSQEQGKLNEADMDYLKQQLRGLDNPYSAFVSTGVSFDLSPEALQLTEAQIKQQIEVGVEGTAPVQTPQTGGADPAPAPTVDLVI